ncbi:MAG: leucine-rich repeat protein, partial [Christensenellales bacterium]
MKKNLKQKLNRKDRWVALALLSLFCCLIFGIWMSSGAWYRDGDRFDISVTLATIEVDSNTDTSLKHKIWVALRHQEVLTDDVTFSISPRSAEFYARIGVFVTTENETSQVAKDIIKYQNFVPTPNEGYSWVRDGEWYYFCDTEGKPAVLGHDDMGKAFGFMSKESFVMPEGLRPQHYAKDDSVELEIRVESVQARHVDASSPTNLAPFFKTSYPTKDYSVTFKDLDGTTLKTQTVRYAGDVTPPSAKQITGKVFQNWNTLIDGTGADIYGEEFNNISQDLVLYPRYMSNEVTVNVVQTANGEITPGTSTTTYGSDLNFVVKANSGYQIESISVGGSPVSITDNNEQIVELKNIVGDTTLTATYGLKEYIISVLSEGEGQTTPNSNQTAHFGDNVEFSFVANEGKYISSLIIDGIEKISGKSTKEFSFTFENISGDHSIYVSYETNVYQVDTYVLPYSDGFVYGEISPVETTCAHGKSVNFVVSAFDGARITSIKVGGQEKLASNDLASTNIVVSPTSDTNIVVCFAPIWKMTVINSKYYITDYLGSSSNVVVPSKIYDPTTQTLVPVYGIRSLNSDIITNLSVSNGIEYVGGNGTNNIFSQTNSNITTVSLPNSIKIIDSYAFLGCSQLTNFSMPSQLEKIGDYAFKDCSNIKAYDMPSTLQQIGVGAFNGNAGLAQLTFNSTTAPTISDGNIFSGTTSELKVRVPANSKAGYVSQLSNRSFAEDTYMYALTGETHLAVCKQNVFRYVYNIDIINGTGGTCDPEAGRVEVYQTQNFAVTFTPLTGNRIEGVYVDSSSDNIVSVAEGDPQTYTFENIQASHMIEVVYSKMYIRLDINGGTGQQPLVVYNDDKSKFRINDNIEPTKSGKEFYYYSTNPSDNEQGQNGDRYDLGLWYDIPNIQSSTTLYAIYLTPSASYTTSQEYIVVPKTVAALSGSSSNNIFGNNQDSIVKYITLHRNTTTIGAYSFNSLGALVGISHSDGVSILGEYAFASCSALTKYRFATMTTSIGESVFEKCVSLERIFNFENTTISTIPTRAFQYCSNLTEINVPNSITAIGEYAFSDSNLASIHLGKTKTAALGNFCFYNCTNLYNIIVSQELGTVGESAFENCENLRTVQDFENTKVTTIYSRAFYNCSNLPSIKLPQTLTLLGVSAFENCSKLTGVSGLENTSITKLSEKTFYKCSTLSNISLPTTLTQIDGSAAWDCVALKNINGLSSTKVTKIGANAFKNTKGLTQITLPTSTFTTFEANCFEGSGLQKITNLKNCSKLATFGISSFDGSGLKEISFPAKSFTIAANAFKNCISLVDVTFNNATAPTVDATSFDGTTNNLKVYIPDGKLDAYAPLQLGGIHNKGFSSGVDSIITAYTAVDYIHFSGAQYIDTEFVPTADTAVEVAFNTSTDGKWLFGSRTAYQSKDTYAIHLYTGSNSIWFQYAGSVPSQQTVSAYSGKKTTVKVDKDYMYVNGNKINSTAFGISGFTTGTWPMFLGEINNNGSKDGRSFIGDIYSFKVWQGSTLVRDMIPCIRNSDGAAGMYDKVEGKFYGNAGSGSLTTGATNSNIVEEYKRLEYIQSSGTQYINTGYWWRTENVQVVLDANIVSAPGSQSLFGSEEHIHGSDWSGRRFAIIPHGGNGSYSLYAYNGSKMTVKIANGKDFVLDISSKASGNTKTLKYNLNIDGAVSSNTASYTGNYGVRTNPDNLTNGLGQIYLFANHNSGSGMYNNASGTPNMNATQIIGGMKVYSFKLYDDGVCVRDYVPALRTRDGEVGLFDQQNGVFYQNAGSGKFTAGAIVDSDAAIKNGATMHYIGKSQTIATCINDMFKRHFNPTMADADYFFTGEVRTMAIKEELPEGASVSYTWKSTDGDSGSGNQFRDVGTYFVTATISGNFYVSTSVTAKLNISRPSLSGITFQDKSFVYDGTKKSITITGTLPEGATVSYSIKGINGESVDAGATNGTTEVGVYLVTATFGGTLEGNALTATLTITKATKTISL